MFGLKENAVFFMAIVPPLPQVINAILIAMKAPTKRRTQKPRSVQEKSNQTASAREARESQRGFVLGWLEGLFIEGMRQSQWTSRAEAARWLTDESRSAAEIGTGGVALCAWDDVNRGYSRYLYEKMKGWEVEYSLTYRPKDQPAPYADEGYDFSVFPRRKT